MGGAGGMKADGSTIEGDLRSPSAGNVSVERNRWLIGAEA